jgi:hypothetical protein
MKATLFGHLDRPAVAVVGVWDPLLPGHRDLFRSISAYTREANLAPLVIVLDPDPARFVWGVAELPIYNDVRWRIAEIRRCGMNGVLLVRFRKADLLASAEQWLELVATRVPLAELWLGARQTLGRGSGGTFEAVAALGQQNGICVKRLSFVPLRTYDVREHLAAGRIQMAEDLVGTPPIWGRPRSGFLRLAWCPGRYRAVALTSAVQEEPTAPEFEVCGVPESNGLARFEWPNPRIRYLRFVSGPGDVRASPGSGGEMLKFK